MKRAIVAAFFLTCAAFTTSAVAKTTLSFNYFLPRTHFTWPVFEKWADSISKATNGEVTINFLPQSVAPAPGILDAVRDGVADGGFMFNGFLEKVAPGLMISQMPWINAGNSKAVSMALWKVYEKKFGKVEQLPGVHLVSMFNLGPAELCSVTNKPIAGLNDLKSRRVWALPGTIVDILKAMGLSIVASPTVQLQELASRSTIDAYYGVPFDTIISFGLAPYTKSCVEMSPAVQSANFSIFFNQRVWSRMTDAQRAAIMKVSGGVFAEQLGAAVDEASASSLKTLLAQGMKLTPADPDLMVALKESAAKIENRWEKAVSEKYRVDGAAILKEMRDTVAAESQK